MGFDFGAGAVKEELFTDPAPALGESDDADSDDADRSYPGGYDTEFGAGRILPSGRDVTKKEDFTSQPSGALVGEEPSEVLETEDLRKAAQGGGGPSTMSPSGYTGD